MLNNESHRLNHTDLPHEVVVLVSSPEPPPDSPQMEIFLTNSRNSPKTTSSASLNYPSESSPLLKTSSQSSETFLSKLLIPLGCQELNVNTRELHLERLNTQKMNHHSEAVETKINNILGAPPENILFIMEPKTPPEPSPLSQKTLLPVNLIQISPTRNGQSGTTRAEKQTSPGINHSKEVFFSKTYIHPLEIMPALSFIFQKKITEESVFPLIFNSEAIIRQSHDGIMPTEFLRRRANKRKRDSSGDSSDSGSSVQCSDDDDEDDEEEDEEEDNLDYNYDLNGKIISNDDSDSFQDPISYFSSSSSKQELKLMENSKATTTTTTEVSQGSTKKGGPVGTSSQRSSKYREDFYDSEDSFIDDSDDFSVQACVVKPRQAGYSIQKGPVPTINLNNTTKSGLHDSVSSVSNSNSIQRGSHIVKTNGTIAATNIKDLSIYSSSSTIEFATLPIISKSSLAVLSKSSKISSKNIKIAEISTPILSHKNQTINNQNVKKNPEEITNQLVLIPGLDDEILKSISRIPEDGGIIDIFSAKNIEFNSSVLYKIFSNHVMKTRKLPNDCFISKICDSLLCSHKNILHYFATNVVDLFRENLLKPTVLKRKIDLNLMAKRTWQISPFQATESKESINRYKRYTSRFNTEMRKTMQDYVEFLHLDESLVNWKEEIKYTSKKIIIDMRQFLFQRFEELKDNFPSNYFRLQDLYQITNNGAIFTKFLEKHSPTKVFKNNNNIPIINNN